MRDPTRQAERLMAIRLRYTINTHLEEQDITTRLCPGWWCKRPRAEPWRSAARGRGRRGRPPPIFG